MNTLSREVTAKLSNWQAIKNLGHGSFTPGEFLVYLVLLGKDWRKAFHPLSRETRSGRIRIENGTSPWLGYEQALWEINAASWEHAEKYNSAGVKKMIDRFNGLISTDTLRKIRDILPFDGSVESYRGWAVKKLLEVNDEAA